MFGKGFRQNAVECRAEKRGLRRHQEHDRHQRENPPVFGMDETDRPECHDREFRDFRQNENTAFRHFVGEIARRAAQKQERQDIRHGQDEQECRVLEIIDAAPEYGENDEHLICVVIEHPEEL